MGCLSGAGRAVEGGGDYQVQGEICVHTARLFDNPLADEAPNEAVLGCSASQESVQADLLVPRSQAAPVQQTNEEATWGAIGEETGSRSYPHAPQFVRHHRIRCRSSKEQADASHGAVSGLDAGSVRPKMLTSVRVCRIDSKISVDVNPR